MLCRVFAEQSRTAYNSGCSILKLKSIIKRTSSELISLSCDFNGVNGGILHIRAGVSNGNAGRCLLPSFPSSCSGCFAFLQRQDEEDRVPVHPVQLGEVRVEASLQPAQVARCLWHHLRGEDTSLWPFCPLLPASVTRAAALGMSLQLRQGGIPSQSHRTRGCVRASGTGDRFTAGRVVLAC